MTDQSNTKFKLFYEDIERNVKKISEKHGIKIPCFNCFILDKAAFFNITAYDCDPKEMYNKWLVENCEKIGLGKDIVNKKFMNSDKSKTLTVIGYDPDGGNECIRVADESGMEYHLSASAIMKLISI